MMLDALETEAELEAPPTPGAVPPPAISEGRRIWIMLALATVTMLASTDRNVLSVLLVPIKNSLHVSDAAMGGLSGAAFALVYATIAIPMARFADRTNRRNLIAAAVAFWSVM